MAAYNLARWMSGAGKIHGALFYQHCLAKRTAHVSSLAICKAGGLGNTALLYTTGSKLLVPAMNQSKTSYLQTRAVSLIFIAATIYALIKRMRALAPEPLAG